MVSEGSAEVDRDAILGDVVAHFEGVDRFGQVPASFWRESFLTLDPLTEGEPVAAYWVNEPYAHVAVRRDPETDQLVYRFVEPALDGFERYVRRDVAATVRRQLLDADLDEAQFRARVDDVLHDHADVVDAGVLEKIRYYLFRDFQGYGAIDPMMSDPNIEDVSCDGSDVPVFVYHADYGNVEADLTFDEERLDDFVVRLAQRCGQHVSLSRPLLTDTLPDGSRVQVTLGADVGARGSNFTIRKFREEPFTPVELVDLRTFSLAQMAYLWLAVEHNRSVLFVGPTASGKTTSMNAVSLFVPPDHKVVSIEETHEVSLPHDNWIADVTRESSLGGTRKEVGTYELLSEALHQRPDHIIVGEIRTDPDVVRTFFQAMGTGHAGFTTFHADSPRDALRRLRHDPLAVPDELLTDLDVISLQQQLDVGGERVRRCRWLTEVESIDEGVRPELREVFGYDPYEDEIRQVADSRLMRELAMDNGWTDEELHRRLRERAQVLAALLEADRTEFEDVTQVVFQFSRNPERVLDQLPTPDRDLPEIDVSENA